MPLPGQRQKDEAQGAPTSNTPSGKQPTVGFHRVEFELPEAGVWHNAVCAERLFRLIENDGRFSAAEKGRMDSKIILCFELEQKRRDGKPFVFTVDFPAGVASSKSPIVKFCKGWSGAGRDLTAEEWAEWQELITGPDGPEGDRAECIGANIRLKLEQKASAKGREYVVLAQGGVEPPDDAHIQNPLKVSEHYKKWDIVQAEFKDRMSKVPAARPDTSKEIPF